MTKTSKLDFTATAKPTNGPGSTSLVYTLPTSLYPSVNINAATTLSVLGTTIPITANLSVSGGLKGGIDLTLGQYSLDYPVTVKAVFPGKVTDGGVFTVDPTLVSTDDAKFSLLGPGAQIKLDFGLSASAGFSVNAGSSVDASEVFSTSFGTSYQLPTLDSFKSSYGTLTIAEPDSFKAESDLKSATGGLPTLTATGQDKPSLTASVDLVQLLASFVPGLGLINSGSYGDTGYLSITWTLLSAPLQASLALDEAVTITPISIGVTLTDTQNGETRSGTLGQAFQFDAPTSGSGTVQINATYTLNLQVASSVGIVGNVSLSVDGPKIAGSFFSNTFSTQIGHATLFDTSFGVGNISSANFDTSLMRTDTYDLSYAAACYRAGTRILTATGEVPIERLRTGDLVVTGSGQHTPIKWIGHRHIDCTRAPRPEAVWPVRVAAHAFGLHQPHRDLDLSPDHAVFVDNVLVPIRELINGTTICQIKIGAVSYYHVELARHDVLLAENLPAESFLDAGNRANFANGGTRLVLHPDFAAWSWENACADLVLSGSKLDAIRARLRGIADAQAPARTVING